MKQEYNPVFYHNFTKSFDVTSFEQKLADDGCVSRNCNGLTINSSKYTAHMCPGPNGLLDHIKWLALGRKSYSVCEGEFVYEACMAAKQIISAEMIPEIYRDRIRNIKEDHRPCASALVMYDEENMITAKILFTDDWIYGYYERRPGYKTSWTLNMSMMGDYAAFTSIIPLCKRGNFSSINNFQDRLNDYVRVGIGIDVSKGTIKFYVNRIEMFCIPRIGYRLDDQYQVSELGGTAYLTVPGCMRFGFGHFSYLDHNIPNNYSREYVVQSKDSNGYSVHRLASGLAQLLPTDKYREPYPDFTGEYTTINPNLSFAYTGSDPNYFNFGQGMITNIKYIAGYVINTRIKMYKMLCNRAFTCFEEQYETNSSESCQCSQCSSLTTSDNDDDFGPTPHVSRIIHPNSTKYDMPYYNKSSTKSPLGNLLPLLRYPDNINRKLPLYRDFGKPSQSSSSYSEDSDRSYSLGDLYKRSRNRKFVTKGDDIQQSSDDDKSLDNNKSLEHSLETENITFTTADMSLNI